MKFRGKHLCSMQQMHIAHFPNNNFEKQCHNPSSDDISLYITDNSISKIVRLPSRMKFRGKHLFSMQQMHTAHFPNNNFEKQCHNPSSDEMHVVSQHVTSLVSSVEPLWGILL